MPFILTIEERGHSWAGRTPAKTVHATRVEAEAELTDYVRRNWDVEMDGDPLPEDSQQMVNEYFSDVLEAYNITEEP